MPEEPVYQTISRSLDSLQECDWKELTAREIASLIGKLKGKAWVVLIAILSPSNQPAPRPPTLPSTAWR